MRKRIYQVYDRVAEMGLGPLMLEHRDGPAIRTFYTVLADKNTQLGQRPQDYALYCTGEYDEEKQQILNNTDAAIGTSYPQLIASGEAWLETQDDPATPRAVTRPAE